MIHRLMALAPVLVTSVSLLALPAAHPQDVKLPPTMTFTAYDTGTAGFIEMRVRTSDFGCSWFWRGISDGSGAAPFATCRNCSGCIRQALLSGLGHASE